MYIWECTEPFEMSGVTEHYHNRKERQEAIEHMNPGKLVKGFIVENFHKNGPEIHWIFDNGVILVVNEWTKKLVTTLIARPAQISRYFRQCGLKIPHELIETARSNQLKGLNQI